MPNSEVDLFREKFLELIHRFVLIYIDLYYMSQSPKIYVRGIEGKSLFTKVDTIIGAIQFLELEHWKFIWGFIIIAFFTFFTFTFKFIKTREPQ